MASVKTDATVYFLYAFRAKVQGPLHEIDCLIDPAIYLTDSTTYHL